MAMEGARGPSGAVGGEDVASGEAELTNLMAPSGAMCLGMDCVGAGDIDGAVLEDESPVQPEKEQQAEARSPAERAEGLEDAQIWWTGPWTHDTHPLAVNRSLGSPGVAPAPASSHVRAGDARRDVEFRLGLPDRSNHLLVWVVGRDRGHHRMLRQAMLPRLAVWTASRNPGNNDSDAVSGRQDASDGAAQQRLL